MKMEVPGKRPRGRPKGRWRDRVGSDMRQLKITDEDADDLDFWRKRIKAAHP